MKDKDRHRRRLVCVTFDGSLELWSRHKFYNPLTETSWLAWEVDHEEIIDGFFGINKARAYLSDVVWGICSPRAWGREILGFL